MIDILRIGDFLYPRYLPLLLPQYPPLNIGANNFLKIHKVQGWYLHYRFIAEVRLNNMTIFMMTSQTRHLIPLALSLIIGLVLLWQSFPTITESKH